jgi:hypothetical protein
MRARRRFPVSGLPSIGIFVPTVISTDPNMIGARTNATMFHDGSRRCGSHDDFGGLHGSDVKAEA